VTSLGSCLASSSPGQMSVEVGVDASGAEVSSGQVPGMTRVANTSDNIELCFCLLFDYL